MIFASYAWSLAGWMFYLGGAEGTPALGKRKAEQLLRLGQGTRSIPKNGRAAGRRRAVIDDPSLLPAREAHQRSCEPDIRLCC